MKENFFSSPFFHQKSQLLLFYPFTREETKYPKSQQHIKQDFHNFAFRISSISNISTLHSDSRHWGLVPDDFIVGVVQWIWFSKDEEQNSIRWNRIGRVD